MELKSILPYFGGKRLTAPQIVSHFRLHTTYYEPFAGSLAVLMAKEPSRLEIVSELNTNVINLLDMLSRQSTAFELWNMAKIQPTSESLFNDADERLQTDDYHEEGDVYRAFDFLLVSWQGPSGLAGTTAKPRYAKRNTASGGSTAARWRAVSESIPAWHERLRNVEFRNQSVFDILEDVPDRDDVTIYLDPPYYGDTRRGGHYIHDFTNDDHEKLACMLKAYDKTCIVVSYYAHPDLDAMYGGWDRHIITAPRKLNNMSGGVTQTVSAGEVVYVTRGAIPGGD